MWINWGRGEEEGRVANRLHYGNSKMVSCRLSYVQSLIKYAFYSAHVRLNGNKLDLKNVRYLHESGVYQCVAENPYGMIASYTVVKVRRKHLENRFIQLNLHSPFTKEDFFFVLR